MDRGLFSHSEDESGEDDVPDSAFGRKSAEPALIAGIRDDNMGPGHLKTAKNDACKDSDERSGDRMPDNVGTKKSNDGAVEKLVDD